MFIILLTYTKPVAEVDQHLAAHRAWVNQGFGDGLLLASGGRRPRIGGVLLGHGADRAEIEALAATDPFVVEGVATAEVIEFRPSRLDPRLAFWTKPGLTLPQPDPTATRCVVACGHRRCGNCRWISRSASTPRKARFEPNSAFASYGITVNGGFQVARARPGTTEMGPRCCAVAHGRTGQAFRA